ncbi:MAG: sialate O-acetylesterase [Verrucomicrobiota bacterium]
MKTAPISKRRPGLSDNLRRQTAGLLVGLLVLAATARAEHYEVFLLAGQSNMDGRGAKRDLVGDLAQWARPQPQVLINFRAGGLHRPLTLSNGFKPLAPGYSGTPGAKQGGLPSATFGPEVSLGAVLAEGLPGKNVALIKCAEGGTNLLKDWAPGEKGKLYEQFIGFVGQALKDLQARGDTCTLRGMAWHQGEGDASLPADKYHVLLTEFIQRVRADLNARDLPFVIGEVYDNGRRDTVRESQRATSLTVPHTALASAQGLKTSDNGTHFDAASQIELGKRFAQAMLPLLAPDHPPNSATK